MSTSILGFTTSSDQLVAELGNARAARRIATVSGNVSDLFLHSDGEPYTFPWLVRLRFGGELGVILWSQSSGGSWLCLAPGQQQPPEAPAVGADVVEAVQRLCELAVAAPTVVIIDYADGLLDDQGDGDLATQRLLELAADQAYRASGSLVVLVDRGEGLPTRVCSRPVGVWPITVGHPDGETRRQALEVLGRRAASDPNGFAQVEASHAMATLAGGLRIDDLVAASRLAARDGTALDADRLRQSRAKALSEQAGDILRVHDTPVRPDEVAGIEQLMRFVHVRAQAGEPLRGIILDGPPGVGKTFVVRAISQAFGYLLVEFRQVYSMYVGETDRRLDRALSLIESLAPCAVWFDEIDQWLPRRGGSSSQDGGTSERLLARLWQFLGATHARQDVMFIGTTNRPDLLDAATLDRAGVVAPLIHPTRHDLPSLGHAIARQQGRTLSPYVDFAALADHHAMAFATARDLHTIIAEAAVLAGGSPIEQHHLASAINDVTAPLDTTAQELMALLAVRSCRHRSLLPWIDANGNPSLPRPPYIDAIIDERGEVDPFRLQERIHRLSGALAWT